MITRYIQWWDANPWALFVSVFIALGLAFAYRANYYRNRKS